MVLLVFLIIGIIYFRPISNPSQFKTSLIYLALGSIFLIPFLLEYAGDYFSDTVSFTISNPFDYAKITDVDFKATLNESSTVNVKETLTFDIHAASKNNLYYELWRGMSEDMADGLTTKYTVKSVTQILPDGTKIPYTESSKLYWDDEDYISPNFGPRKWYHSGGPYSEYFHNYECLMIYPDPVYRDKLKFEIEYDIKNIVFKYRDCSELYLQIYKGDETKYLNSFKAEIIIPESMMPKKDNYYARAYGTNSVKLDYQLDKTKNAGSSTFVINLNKKDLKFRPYNKFIEFLIVSYNEDKHIFSEKAPDNIYSNDLALEELEDERDNFENQSTIKIVKLIILIVCALLSFVAYYRARKEVEKAKKVKGPVVIPEYDYDYYSVVPSDIDLLFAAALFHCKDDKPRDLIKDAFPAILFDLVKKGLIRIDYEKLSITDLGTPVMTDAELELYFFVKKHTSTFPLSAEQLLSEYINEYKISCITNSFSSRISDFDFYAKLQDLSEKNAIEYTTNNLGQSVIFAKEFPSDTLPPSEAAVYNLIKRYATNGPINIDTFFNKLRQDYNSTVSFEDKMYKIIDDIGIVNHYFITRDFDRFHSKAVAGGRNMIKIGIIITILFNFFFYLTHIGFAYGGFFLLGITCFACGKYLLKESKNLVLLTSEGELEYAKWQSYYNYLKNESLYRETDMENIDNYEKCLIYAIALGLPNKVIDSLKIKFPKVSSFYENNNNRINYYNRARYRSYGHRMSRSTHYARSVSTSSSYSGSSYSRGGRGGGGGH